MAEVPSVLNITVYKRKYKEYIYYLN